MVQPKKAKTGLPFIAGIFGFALIAILALFVRRSMSHTQTYQDQRESRRLEKLGNLRKEERNKLEGYAWADKAKGTVQIPIDRAMALTLTDLKAKGVVASAVKADPNVTNIVPIYAQSKPAAPATPAAVGAAPAPGVK